MPHSSSILPAHLSARPNANTTVVPAPAWRAPPPAVDGVPRPPDLAPTQPPAKRQRGSTPTDAGAHPLQPCPNYGQTAVRPRQRPALPSELWLQVARHGALTPRELTRLAAVSQQFRAVFGDNALWYGSNDDTAQLASDRARGLPVRRDVLFAAFRARVRTLPPKARQLLGDIYRQGEGYKWAGPLNRRWASTAGRYFDVAMAAAHYGLLSPHELRLVAPTASRQAPQRALLLLDAGHPRSTTYSLLPPPLRDDVELTVASLRGRSGHFVFVLPKLAGRPEVVDALFANDVSLALYALCVGHPGLLGTPTVADALVAACSEARRPHQLGAEALHDEARRSWRHVPRGLLHQLPVARALLRAWPAGFSQLPPTMQSNLPLLHQALADGLDLRLLPPASRELPGVALAAVRRAPEQVRLLGPQARRDPAIAWMLLSCPRVDARHFWELDATVFGDPALMRALLPRHPSLAWRTNHPALADVNVACTLVGIRAYGMLPRLHQSVALRQDFVLYALKQDVRALPYLAAAQTDRALVLRCLAVDGMLLARLPQYAADEGAVLAAVRSCGQALRFAACALQECAHVGLAALDQDLGALPWTSLQLRDRDELLQRYDWGGRPELWPFLSYRLSRRVQVAALTYRPAPLGEGPSPVGLGV